MTKRTIFIFIFAVSFFTNISSVKGANVYNLVDPVHIFFTPNEGVFGVGTVFKTQVYINTNENTINAIDLSVDFDQTKLYLIDASPGQSIFTISVAKPEYNNKPGIISMSGVSTKGIKSNNALVAELSFKVLAEGQANISVNNKTAVYLNDGYGSGVLVRRDAATYSLSSNVDLGQVNSDSRKYSISDYKKCSYDDIFYCYPLIIILLIVLFILELIIHYIIGKHTISILKDIYKKLNNVRFEDRDMRKLNNGMPVKDAQINNTKDLPDLIDKN